MLRINHTQIYEKLATYPTGQALITTTLFTAWFRRAEARFWLSTAVVKTRLSAIAMIFRSFLATIIEASTFYAAIALFTSSTAAFMLIPL